MNIKLSPTNGQPLQPTRPAAPDRRMPRGRDMADAAVRLRVYLATELRRQCQEHGLEAEHYGPSAVTVLTIALEKQGVRGIAKESADA